MDKTLVCQGVATKLFAAEKSVDTAIAEAAALMTGLTEARDELRLSMVVTDQAAKKIMAALTQLSEARSALCEAHAELDEVKLRLGVRTKMIGWFDKGPGVASRHEGVTELSRVA